VEEAEFGVLNVTGCAWEGLKTVTLSIAGIVRSEDGVVDLSSWLLTYVVARGGHRSSGLLNCAGNLHRFTITTRSGVPCIMLTGEIEAIDGVSTQSPQDKEPRAKAIARVHEQPRMALRKAWGTSGCLIALFESREKLGSWSALPLGEPRLQMAKRGDWLRPRGSQNNAEVGKPPSTLH
jgi:hypothetical protein